MGIKSIKIIIGLLLVLAIGFGFYQFLQKQDFIEEERAVTIVAAPEVPSEPSREQTAILAGGCFWCVEADIEKLPGVISAISGYSGGASEKPDYKNYAKGGH